MHFVDACLAAPTWFSIPVGPDKDHRGHCIVLIAKQRPSRLAKIDGLWLPNQDLHLSSEASKKALLNMAMPPSLIFTSCFFKISSLIFLAASTTSTTSVGFSPGNWTVTVTAVDLWSGSCKRPIIDERAKAGCLAERDP